MRILITGATGFIGGHMVKALQNQGHDLALLVRRLNCALRFKNSDTLLIMGELGDLEPIKSALKKFNPHVLIHLAWEGIPDFSAETAKANLDYAINIIHFLANHTDCKKIISSGSCAEYGKTDGPCKESEIIDTTTFLAWAKYAIYKYASILCPTLSIELIWFRIFYVYGPGQRSKSLIPMLVDNYSKNQCPEILNPDNKNDFIHIKDVVEAFKIAALTNIASGIYNLGSGVSTSVYDVCKLTEQILAKQTSLSGQLIQQKKSKKVTDFWADTQKTEQILKFKPRITLKEGLKDYIQAITGSTHQ